MLRDLCRVSQPHDDDQLDDGSRTYGRGVTTQLPRSGTGVHFVEMNKLGELLVV